MAMLMQRTEEMITATERRWRAKQRAAGRMRDALSAVQLGGRMLSRSSPSIDAPAITLDYIAQARQLLSKADDLLAEAQGNLVGPNGPKGDDGNEQ